MTEVVIAGLILGSLSSFHCVGMCGPIALSLPVSHMPQWKQVLSVAVYNSGRIFTYITLGFIFGIAGRNIHLAGYQQWFSIISGALLILMAFQQFVYKYQAESKIMSGFRARLGRFMNYAFRLKSVKGFAMLGLANGLLPCGMVYLAVAGAVNSDSVQNSMLFMGMFGLGTFPAMMLIGIAGMGMKLSLRQKMKNMVPYIMSVMGILLVLRGMNLGIPFISPQLFNGVSDSIICH